MLSEAYFPVSSPGSLSYSEDVGCLVVKEFVHLSYDIIQQTMYIFRRYGQLIDEGLD